MPLPLFDCASGLHGARACASGTLHMYIYKTLQSTCTYMAACKVFFLFLVHKDTFRNQIQTRAKKTHLLWVKGEKFYRKRDGGGVCGGGLFKLCRKRFLCVQPGGVVPRYRPFALFLFLLFFFKLFFLVFYPSRLDWQVVFACQRNRKAEEWLSIAPV